MTLNQIIIDEIKEIALKEILNPSWDLTKQFLNSINVEEVNKIPKIARIDTDDSDGKVIVYFPIREEKFYLALYFDTITKIELVDVGTEPGIKVYLFVYDSLKINKDNFPYYPIKIGNKNFTFSVDKGEPDELEDKLNLLLDKLESEKDRFIEFSKKTHMSLNVAYYGYKEQMWGIHLCKKTLKRLVDLNIDFDLDLYASGRELQE